MEYRGEAIQTGRETRSFTGDVELRAADGQNTLVGYALKFEQKYPVAFFTEEIARDALKDADMSDVRALLNHDPNFVLGRTTSNTLRLSVDEIGLRYEILLPETQAAKDLAVSIKRGDISQSSWGFTLMYDENRMGDEWTRVNGKDHRRITNVKKVYDVSPVTFPANPNTDVAKRSHDMAIQPEIEKQAQISQRGLEIRYLLAAHSNK